MGELRLMSPAKRDDSRSTRRGSKSEQPPASRRRREHRVVRWIGAAKRRSKKSTEIAAVETRTAHIIRLRCADTFSRPVRLEVAVGGAQLLPFQGWRSADGSPRCA
jgi:hypothetical protein